MGAITLNEYQSEAMQTLQPGAELAYTLTKLMIEAAEAAQPIIKQKYHGAQPPHSDEIVEELGDALYYIAASAALCGSTLEEVAQRNIAKLRERHGETYRPGFYRG